MRHYIVFALCWLAAASAQAAEIRIAVAANFTATLERLTEVYGPDHGVSFLISSGSSGQHFSQIRQGAPFDLFFSADDLRTADLVASGHAVANSRFVYAQGILVLWSRDPDRIPEDGLGLLKSGDFRRLAMANPRVSPYGAAAQALLRDNGIMPGRGQIVTAPHIGMAFGFVSTANADVGFVALSQVIQHERRHGAGSRWVPDPALHPPILQEAVLLTQAREPEAAQAFLDWMRTSEAARAIIEADGYRVMSNGPSPSDS